MKLPSQSLAKIAAIVIVASGVAVSVQADVPNVLYPYLPEQAEAGIPAWVSASSTENGAFVFRQLKQVPRFAKKLESRIASQSSTTATGKTLPSKQVVFEPAKIRPLALPKSGTLTDLMQSSLGIYSGEVLSVTPGLLFGARPGSVIELAVHHVYRDAPEISQQESLLIFVPVGSFDADGAHVIAQSRRWGSIPKAGDKLVFFALGLPWDTSGRLLEAFTPNSIWYSSQGVGLTTAESGNPKPSVPSFAALEARLSSSSLTERREK